MMRQIVLGVAAACCAVGTAFAAPGDDNKIQGTEKLASVNENTRGDIDKAQRKFEYATARFYDFRTVPEDDAKKAYGAFKNEVDEFVKQVNDARNKIVSAERDAAVYFANWEADDSLMTDTKRRERSQRRRAAAQAAFQAHLDAFKSIQNIWDSGMTILLEQVTLLKDNHAGRTAPAAMEAGDRVQRLAEDAYWDVDNVFSKTELFD